MCILCIVQRWSRRVATMLPYLVIPLVILWAFTQLFPPGYRFEITSSRLGCVIVLLLTLFWYEILNPQLQIWRTRRSAWLRERHHAQALELQKLKKTATRRCRNCLNPYRDQNPGGGRFMCSFCGHISKRPVLDLPVPIKSKGIIDDFVGKNSWMCSQAWSAEGNGSWGDAVPRNWIGNMQCYVEKSYPGVLFCGGRLLSSFFTSLSFLCGKAFHFGSRGDGSSDADRRGLSNKRGDNGGNSQESRSEKARRKTEERRQARVEKEMLEEEERKQREEVAKLVEERRKLRDVKLVVVEREHPKDPFHDGEKESRKELEKKNHDRRKDKDRGSTKSNSDNEDPEKRASRESERKRDFEKKSVNERRESPRTSVEVHKSHTSEVMHGSKVTPSKPRYFGRVTGNFLSSSQGFGSASLFRRSSQNPIGPLAKPQKAAVGLVDHSSGTRRGPQIRTTTNGDGRILGTNLQSVGSEPRPATPKKPWHQLFTRSTAVSPYPNSNSTSHQNQNTQSANTVNQRQSFNCPSSHSNYYSDNQFDIERPFPFTGHYPSNGLLNCSSFPHLSTASALPPVKNLEPSSLPEEPEHFEDPCYDPDPVSLLGPVSESLDSFPLDLGVGFISDENIEVLSLLKNSRASIELNKPSPIESPISRSRALEEKSTKPGLISSTPKSVESHKPDLDKKTSIQGTWQMWGTPLVQDRLGLVCEPSSWLLPIEQNNKGDATTLQFAKENYDLPGTQSPQHVHRGNKQNGGTHSPHGHHADVHTRWLSKEPLQLSPVDGGIHFLPLCLMDNIQRADAKDDGSKMSPTCWNEKEWLLKGNQNHVESAPATPPLPGGLFLAGSNLHSVWAFNQSETNTLGAIFLQDADPPTLF